MLKWDRGDPRWRLRLMLVPPIMLAYLALDYLIIRYVPPNPFFAHLFLLGGGMIAAALTGLFRAGQFASGLVGGMMFGFGASFFIWALSGKALPELLRGELLTAAASLGRAWMPFVFLAIGSYVTTALIIPVRAQGDHTR